MHIEMEKRSMKYRLIHIGFGNMAVAERIVAIIQPASSPVKRLKDDARENGRLIDATQGRKTRSIIITDSNHIILSAIQPETIVLRIDTEEQENDNGEKL
jgi:regulator of extracellular matrix RemA (YlzA/DUF370 family)